jgi:hypothetical protein
LIMRKAKFERISAIRDDKFDQEIGRTRYHAAGNHFRHFRQRRCQAVGIAAGMPIDLDLDKDGEAKTHPAAVEICPIATDDATFLQALGSAQARGWRQMNAVGQLHIGQPGFLLQFAENSQICLVEINFWHI